VKVDNPSQKAVDIPVKPQGFDNALDISNWDLNSAEFSGVFIIWNVVKPRIRVTGESSRSSFTSSVSHLLPWASLGIAIGYLGRRDEHRSN
jgi:hypothetical protein